VLLGTYLVYQFVAASSFKLEVISPHKQKPAITHGHESTVIMRPSPDHLEAFRSGLDHSPPLKIIKHVSGFFMVYIVSDKFVRPKLV
jgi:hypothetical protein